MKKIMRSIVTPAVLAGFIFQPVAVFGAKKPADDDKNRSALIGALANQITSDLSKSFKKVQKLLTDGVSPDTKDKDGCPVLILAAKAGSFPAVQLLLEFDADPTIQDYEDHTARDIVTAKVAAAVEKKQASKKKDKELQELKKMRQILAEAELIRACENSDIAKVQKLLSEVESKNLVMSVNCFDIRDDMKMTPLMYAARKRSKDITENLLTHGADPLIENNEEMTALKIAEKAKSNEDIPAMLITKTTSESTKDQILRDIAASRVIKPILRKGYNQE